MPSTKTAIVWFRQDLRLSDNPALCAAVAGGLPILPIYILDDENPGEWSIGAASRWWLHESLASLDRSLQNRLCFFRGAADKLLPQIARESGATEIYWNRCYEQWRITRDSKLKKELQGGGLLVRSYNGSLLFEPQNVKKADGTPYRVFTPFYRNGCLRNAPPPRQPIKSPSSIDLVNSEQGVPLSDLELVPRKKWYQTISEEWQPGEIGAMRRLESFIENGISNYKSGRDRPDLKFVSRLSPHLHFGEVSPHQAWTATEALADDPALTDEVDHFRRELGWREFSSSLLFYWPELVRENLQRKFDRFPWRTDETALECWQQGRTGYPIVDAGMRELWQTGYMHNRVRMIVGSFLVKNLLLHWHHGEDWFWDTLVDADLANNSAGWQWIAGSGADAAPYFRIFNPVTQGQKFDPHGDYVRRYLPQLAALPNKFLHCPWLADESILTTAGIRLGDDYPAPIVDIRASRERALLAFKSLSSSA